MRCFSSKKSLILLTCIAAAIVLVCGGMVVTAYISWKHRKEVAIAQDAGAGLASQEDGRKQGGSEDRTDTGASAGSAGVASTKTNVVLQDVLKLRACANRKWLEMRKSHEDMEYSSGGVRRDRPGYPALDADDAAGDDDEDDGSVSSGSGDSPLSQPRRHGVSAPRPSETDRVAPRPAPAQEQQPGRDACEYALQCNDDPFLTEYMRRLSDLPTCPCFYPKSHVTPSTLPPNARPPHASSGGGHQEQLWDESKQRFFRWKEAPYTAHQLSVYHSGAHRCIWSAASPSSGTLASQSCCYDERSRLITRGPGAGTPLLVSPDVSHELHYALDRLPWLLCGGDWTRYNRVRPPNNGRNCRELPDQIEYLYLAFKAKDT